MPQCRLNRPDVVRMKRVGNPSTRPSLYHSAAIRPGKLQCEKFTFPANSAASVVSAARMSSHLSQLTVDIIATLLASLITRSKSRWLIGTSTLGSPLKVTIAALRIVDTLPQADQPDVPIGKREVPMHTHDAKGEQPRVLNRKLARELRLEELEQVTGGQTIYPCGDNVNHITRLARLDGDCRAT
jgi:hypothetical protein